MTCAHCGKPIESGAYIFIRDGKIVVMHTHCAGM